MIVFGYFLDSGDGEKNSFLGYLIILLISNK